MRVHFSLLGQPACAAAYNVAFLIARIRSVLLLYMHIIYLAAAAKSFTVGRITLLPLTFLLSLLSYAGFL